VDQSRRLDFRIGPRAIFAGPLDIFLIFKKFKLCLQHSHNLNFVRNPRTPSQPSKNLRLNGQQGPFQ
jgi:hypothetical protein